MAQPGLFDTIGATPDLVREQLMMQQQQQNQDWASSLGQMAGQYGGSAAAAAIYQGAQGAGAVGSGIGNMIGAEDPRIGKAQRVKKAVEAARSRVKDKTNQLEMYEALVQSFSEEGLDQEALQAAEALRKAKSDSKELELKEFDIKERAETARMRAETAKAIAEAKAAGKPWADKAFELAKSGRYDPASLQKFAETGNIEVLEFDNKEEWTEPYSINVNGKLVRVQKNKKTGKEFAVAGNEPNNISNTSLSVKAFDGLQNLREGFLKETKPFDDTINASTKVEAVLEDALTNPEAASAARNLFASVFRVDSQTSKAEIDRMVNAGSLPDRVASQINNFFSGTLTADKIKNMKAAIKQSKNEAVSGRAKIQQQYRSRRDLPKTDMEFVTGGAGQTVENADQRPDQSNLPPTSPNLDAILNKYPPKVNK